MEGFLWFLQLFSKSNFGLSRCWQKYVVVIKSANTGYACWATTTWNCLSAAFQSFQPELKHSHLMLRFCRGHRYGVAESVLHQFHGWLISDIFAGFQGHKCRFGSICWNGPRSLDAFYFIFHNLYNHHVRNIGCFLPGVFLKMPL